MAWTLRKFSLLLVPALVAAPFALSLGVGHKAQAQALQCRIPERLARPQIELPPKRDIRRTPIAGYVLALSWSPEYCRNKGQGKNRRSQLQCNGDAGDFGFILHGLWPEAKGPNYPQWCRSVGLIPAKVIQQNFCMTPDVQLLQHEWAKHGSCMTRKPETYFAAARTLYSAVRFPDMARLSIEGQRGRRVTAGRLVQEFTALNPDLPPSAVSVQIGRSGFLKEVRLCLGKNFRPAPCPAHNTGAPNKAQVKIWRGR